VKRVCAWCDKPYGEWDGGGESELVTHGICPGCESFFSSVQPGSLREHLNTYDEPIVCVDSDCRVLTANDPACDLLGHDQSTVGDLLFGEVVLCPWALRESGCGQHEHCLACTVRKTVGHAFATGNGVTRQAAYVDRILSNGQVQHIRMLVTSEPRADHVLLQIHEVEVC
jgi:hypothetical protein